jgi:hypothetical protein
LVVSFWFLACEAEELADVAGASKKKLKADGKS